MKKLSEYLFIDPYPVTGDGEIKILYKGKLTVSRQNKLFVYYGYGRDLVWNYVDQRQMEGSSQGFLATIKVRGNDQLNICFHDDQGHWDNNKGRNWSLIISKKGC
ncbi:MAG TPA: carbohydrate-binding protein [Bacillota bacterium]|nr:carbohydrate-binding protein [Bacillota bacterium]